MCVDVAHNAFQIKGEGRGFNRRGATITFLAWTDHCVYDTEMTYRIFIDGAAGTTGLQVHERLAAHPAVDPVVLDEASRKDADAGRALMADCDMTILCLPDDAARDSAAMARDVGAQGDRCILGASCRRWLDIRFVELDSRIRDAWPAPRRSATRMLSDRVPALTRPLVDAGFLAPDAKLTVPAVSATAVAARR